MLCPPELLTIITCITSIDPNSQDPSVQDDFRHLVATCGRLTTLERSSLISLWKASSKPAMDYEQWEKLEYAVRYLNQDRLHLLLAKHPSQWTDVYEMEAEQLVKSKQLSIVDLGLDEQT